MEIRTRFAPSPTGFMHIGNLRTALYAYLFAKQKGGKFIVRVEDTDQERLIEGAEEMIFKTLEQANIIWDEGGAIGGDYGPYTQSLRKDIYIKYAKKLVTLGGAYYCFCDKCRLESLKDESNVKKYDKHCLNLTQSEIEDKLKTGLAYVIRQNIPLSGTTSYTDLVFGEIKVNCEDMEDGVLLKSDGMPTYNFANVIDDYLMKINYVIRGSEYLSSTPKYNLIYDAFGWERPNYMHLSPIMKDKDRKLSKRHGDANFNDFIEKGYLSEAIINYIALLGWSPQDNQEKMSMEELIEKFDVKGISRSSSIFDEEKLKWLNSLYIKELAFDTFHALALPYYQKSVIEDKYDYKLFSHLLQSRVDILSDIPEKVKFIDDFKEYSLDLFYNKKMKTDKDMASDEIGRASCRERV